MVFSSLRFCFKEMVTCAYHFYIVAEISTRLSKFEVPGAGPEAVPSAARHE